MKKGKNFIIPIFVPFLGCPHKCSFCNQEKISGETNPDLNKVRNKISKYLSYITGAKKYDRVEVAYYGGSFSGLPFYVQEQWLQPAYELKQQGKIDGIRISTRPDYINDKVLNFLKEFGVDTIEIGAQSLNDQVLAFADRGHTSEDVLQAAKKIKRQKINLGIQLMVGLPGDSKKRAVASAIEAAALQPDLVRIYPTLVIRNTKLEQMYNQGEFMPWNLDEAIAVTKDMAIIFYKNKISIARIGLQDTEELKDGAVIAGPYHPSFGELVETAIYRDMIEVILNQVSGGNLDIKCARAELSKVIGNKGKNKNELMNLYNMDLSFSGDASIPKGTIIITNAGRFRKKITREEFFRKCRINI
ncbi:histone acetyltransferase (RNA polymerase elongator complex component) [Desulfitispora alkaliphila]|uniref:elongator complex protein 3 n=1 Tax=Desulfitispora alkaliphila TaxID=622674 RepID=UPI003D1DF5F4